MTGNHPVRTTGLPGGTSLLELYPHVDSNSRAKYDKRNHVS